jgi:hypothetical protein
MYVVFFKTVTSAVSFSGSDVHDGSDKRDIRGVRDGPDDYDFHVVLIQL